MRMRRAVVSIVVALLVGAGVAAIVLGDTRRAGARPASRPTRRSRPPPRAPATDKNGVQHLHFEYGPLDIRPGQNIIETNQVHGSPSRRIDGWIVGIRPNLQPRRRHGPARRRDPPAPRRVAHRHRRDATAPMLPRAVLRRRRGEDRAASCRRGYGYRYTHDRQLVAQLHDPQPHREAVQGVDHLRHRLHAHETSPPASA